MLESQQQRAIQRVSGRGSAGSSTSSTSSTSSNNSSTGKVRLLFEERRTTVPAAPIRRGVTRSGPASTTGWDRSYPLDPLSKPTRTNMGPASAGRPAPRAVPPQRPVNPRANKPDNDISLRSLKTSLLRDTNANRLSPNDDLQTAVFGGKLANVGGLRNGAAANNNDDDFNDGPIAPRKPLVKSLAEPKYKVAPAKRPEQPPRSTAVPAPTASRPTLIRKATPPSPARSSASSSGRGSSTASPELRKPSSTASSIRGSPTASPAAPVPNLGPVPAGMAECGLCGRRFAEDRISKHEEICRKTKSKKRKVFDPVKMRVAGTEVEAYVKKASRKPDPKKAAAEAAAANKKSNWRKKHEEFIETIRQAKLVTQHLEAGGKLSDLPPPKPMDTSDYIQCPHCARKFSEGAAERHIPRCASIKSNKPAPSRAPPRKR